MKSALVIGASRGIGRQIALTFAKNGYQVGVAAKTTESTEKLPSSIYSVTEEIASRGGKSLPLVCNVREDTQILKTIQTCIDKFNGLDTLIYNAGAIQWKKVIDTPIKQFDLMHEVNLRGAYIAIQEILPHFLDKNRGQIILVCPPVYNRFFRGKTTYSLSKVGLTVLVHGLGMELQNTGVSITGLWPATAIESYVTIKEKVPPGLMRKADIFADACLQIVHEEDHKLINGKALLDEDYLRIKGISDFSQYRCDPENEPPRMMPKVFPSLLVEEEEQSTVGFSKL